MTTATAPTDLDPRPLYDIARHWVHDLIAGVRADQLDQPTGCPDFDVRTLLGHLVATVHRARVIGAGGDPSTVPFVVRGVADRDWAQAYADGSATAARVWDDDALLAATVTAPWGRVPGAAAMWAYLNEALVHGFDLAAATGQESEADPDAVLPVLERVGRFIPAGPREGMPFAPLVEPAADAGPTERLANWSGRTTRTT